MNEITFIILKIVISITAALVTVYLIPYIKSNTKTKQQEDIMKMVGIAVKAAEQTLETGSAKKAAVIDYMTKWFNEQGIKINYEQLDKLIEAAVYSMRTASEEIKAE